MLNTDKTVLVTGATGRQGGAVVRHMLAKGWKLRALTRHCDSCAAKKLADQGVELKQGDLEDPTALERAARGAYGVFSVQDFWAVGARREVQQGKNLAEAAKKARVEHFVYSSVGGDGIANKSCKTKRLLLCTAHILPVRVVVRVLLHVGFKPGENLWPAFVGLARGCG